MRLWLRLVLILAAVSVSALLLMGWAAMRVATTRAVQTSQDRLIRESEFDADATAAWLEGQLSALQGWRVAFRESLADLTPEMQIGLLRAVHRGMDQAVTVALVDAQGQPVVPPVYLAEGGPRRGAGSAARASLALSHAPIVEALEKGGALGSPWRADGAGQASVCLAVRAAEVPPLVLVVDIDLSILSDLERSNRSEHAVAVLDGEGRAVTGQGHPLVRPDLLTSLLGSEASFALHLEEGDVYGAIHRIRGSDWQLVVVESDKEALRTADEIRDRMASIVVFVVALAVLLGAIAARSVSDPLAALRTAALRVADGAYGDRVNLDRNDEIGELARAFDLMSGRLHHNREEIEAQRLEIEAFNRELVARVDERTAQLRAAQAELVRSSQLAAVAELGGGLAHELNNPLTAVLGLLQVARTRADDASRPLLDAAEAEGQRCRAVVETMLRMGAPEASGPSGTVVDLRQVAAEVAMALAGPWRQQGVELGPPDEGPGLPIVVDRSVLQRVLIQALGSVRASAAPGAHVGLRAGKTGAAIWLEARVSAVRTDGGSARDDATAASMGRWVARQTLDPLGARLLDFPDGLRLEFPC